MELSPQQHAAVLHSGTPALVVAGAGSGKTRTLTAKIRHLIDQGAVPETILAITFTNKAAEEMKRRLTRITGLSIHRFPWVRTYHSACLMILKTHAQKLGFSTPIQILTPYHQQKIMKEILVGRNLDKKHTGAMLNRISNAKNHGNPEQYIDHHGFVSGVRVIDIFHAYEKTLKAQNAVDFDNILLMTRDLLKNETEIREHYRNFFSYLLVDEYQDTNNLQEELTRLFLGHGNLFCVGDDWQAIYGFRGSNVNHFLSFQRNFPTGKIFRLEQNFRSADEIVQAANGLINNNQDKMAKVCFSEKRGGVMDIHEFFNESEEAQWVAAKIQALFDMGIDYDQIAILYRTKFCSLAFEKTFRACKIPYRMVGGKGFFERMEVQDINAYLAAAAFPKDDVSFERVVNTPKRGIGPAMVKKIGTTRTGDMSFQDAARKIIRERILTPKVHGALTDFIDLLDTIREMPPASAIETVIQRTGYAEYLHTHTRGNEADYTSKMENIEQLIHAAGEVSTIAEYLEEAALIREDRSEDDDSMDQGVSLLTIHAAKGLEYHTVFTVGLEEQLFPHWRSLDRPQDLEEERRLMYVAITRAESRLYLTSSAMRKGQYNLRSRFVRELENVMR